MTLFNGPPYLTTAQVFIAEGHGGLLQELSAITYRLSLGRKHPQIKDGEDRQVKGRMQPSQSQDFICHSTC